MNNINEHFTLNSPPPQPSIFPIILLGSKTLLTGMIGISLHMQWPLTSHLHGIFSQKEQLVPSLWPWPTWPTVSPTTAVAEAAAAVAEAEAAAALPAAADPLWAIPASPGTAGSLGRLSDGDMDVSFGRFAAWDQFYDFALKTVLNIGDSHLKYGDTCKQK
jgi:hypothetical protein